MKINLFIYWIIFIWQFELVYDKIIINSFKKFLESENKISMFAFICNNFNVRFMQQMLMLLLKFKSYKNCFDSKNVEILFTYKNENYVNYLKFDKKSLYDFLYALLKKVLNFIKLFIEKFCVKSYSRVFQLC